MLGSRITAVLALTALLAGCGGDALAPFEPQVNNNVDSFELQATGVTTTTTSGSYTWQNTGTQATINHSTVTSAGTAHLVIRDAMGTVVYDADLVPSLNEPTAAGVAGNWQVRVTLTNYTGTINFRAEKL